MQRDSMLECERRLAHDAAPDMQRLLPAVVDRHGGSLVLADSRETTFVMRLPIG
jgi:hypothetical protein